MSNNRVQGMDVRKLAARYLKQGDRICAVGDEPLPEPMTIVYGYVNGADDSYHGWDNSGAPIVVHGNESVHVTSEGYTPEVQRPAFEGVFPD